MELVARVPGALNVSPFPRWVTRALQCNVHIGPEPVKNMLPSFGTMMAEVFRPPSTTTAEMLEKAGAGSVDAFLAQHQNTWPAEVELVDRKPELESQDVAMGGTDKQSEEHVKRNVADR